MGNEWPPGGSIQSSFYRRSFPHPSPRHVRSHRAKTSMIGTPTPLAPKLPGWLGDFAWRDGRVVVRKTGVSLAIDGHLIAEVLSWLVYLPLLGAVAVAARVRLQRRLAVWYAPELPRPWYLMRGVALWAGLSVAPTEASADAAFYFDDVTRGNPPATLVLNRFNFDCSDVSKSHVAEVFADVFRYPLQLDPATSSGPIVEKSETNGVHDGPVVLAPVSPQPGRVYQRLIDTEVDGFNHDLRTPCVGGVPIVVWHKYKPAGGSFAIHSHQTRLRDPAEVFSINELALIRRFNARMCLDWGGLDILRDRHDGRIYVVDVNKTDLGPVISLSWRDKITSMNCLAAAMAAMVTRGNRPEPDVG